MKHVLQTAASAFISLAAALSIGMSPALHAQTQSTNDLPLVQPESVPQSGTFWKLSSFNAAWGRFIEPPLPFNPVSFYNLTNGDFYLLRTNSFVLDDSAIDWPAAYAAKRDEQLTLSLLFGDLSTDESSETSESMDSSSSFPSNSLWLEITDKTQITNGWVGVTLHNTIADLAYDLLYKLSLPDTNAWVLDQQIIGSETTNSTFTWVSMAGRTNLFLWAKSWVDSDGSGLPDWWQTQNFGHLGVDPYADPDGDGWTNLQEFQNGTNPNQFNTPRAPTGLTASYRSGTATVSWNPSPGPVIAYVIQRDIPELSSTDFYTNAASATTHQDNPFPALEPNGIFDSPTYQVTALYAAGSSPPSEVALYGFDYSVSAFVRGPQGNLYLTCPRVPATVTAVQLVSESYDLLLGTSSFTRWTLPTSGFTNGIYLISQGLLPPLDSVWQWFLEVTNSLGALTETIYVNAQEISTIPFFDGREQLKQNLAFQLRAANGESPFQFRWTTDENDFNSFFPSPADYPHEGLYDLETDYSQTGPFGPYEFGPFMYNYLYRNFAFAPANLDSVGRPITGADRDTESRLVLYDPSRYLFQAPTNVVSIPSVLSTNDSRWGYFYRSDSTYYLSQFGITLSGSNWTMASGATNLFGLPYLSAKLAWGSNTTENATLTAGGGSIPYHEGYFYPETAQPVLQTVEYYFVRLWHYFPYPTFQGGYGIYGGDFPPVPGLPNFYVTNTTPLLIVSADDQRVKVGCWAKMAITNGYSDKFAYLEQYFDKAYKISTNGIVTTNQTGLPSPYGEFFPTEPGPTALVTMPDLNTGQRGTGVVNVIKLQLDVNHDGIMDLTFGGPDNTSANRPFVFWINNDWDRNEQDSVANSDRKHDYIYPVIASKRDLEDYARLWVMGLPLLPASNGYAVTLSWANVTGNPAIRLFRSCETNGGIGYLSDTNIAAQQAAYSGFYMTNSGYGAALDYLPIDAGNPFLFPANFFAGGTNGYFLFEGASTGSGQLVLTISQNGQTIAQTSAWLDLHDIKDLYEAAVITNNTTGAVSNWTSSARTVQYAAVSDANETQDIIVMVHGINVDDWHWVNASETVIKRLYWSGYHGKFATVKWPCDFLWKLVFGILTTDYTVFNKSELQAYTSGPALKTYLDELHARFPGYRLHLFVHSQGNAIVSEAIEAGATFDSYILTQAAMPASSYDVTYPLHAGLSNSEAMYGPTPEWEPMGYRGFCTNMTGRIVNLYNPQDPVLDYWINDQGAAKPNLPATPYRYDGTNGSYNPAFGSSYIVTDPHESRAYVSRSRTLPIGQSGPGSGHGVIQSAMDLNAQFGFGHSFPDDHSAQWAWPIQTTRSYFQQVLRSCQIIPAQ